MENEDQFVRELRMRGLQVDQEAETTAQVTYSCLYLSQYDIFLLLNDDYVVSVLRWHKVDKAVNVTGRGQGPQLCLVMPAAERSLQHIIDSEQIAVDLSNIVYFANKIGKALNYLHSEQQLVHADFKPRNVVRFSGEYKLIDFDAAVKVRT
jgi:serine/threonine protein kinase